ncbi:MAG: hypothetical protein HPY53_01590 [Brevinematales bacterium]|nr:hypothetical protein [Brevinematales bacterium]
MKVIEAGQVYERHIRDRNLIILRRMYFAVIGIKNDRVYFVKGEVQSGKFKAFYQGVKQHDLYSRKMDVCVLNQDVQGFCETYRPVKRRMDTNSESFKAILAHVSIL